MAQYFMKLAQRPCELSAGLLAVLAHILLVVYFATATVGNSVAGAMTQRVVDVALQEGRASIPAVSQQTSSVARKSVEVAREAVAAAPILPHLPDASLRGQHYFASSELTQKPLVAVDIPENFALLVPGAPDQVAVLRLLISEYGDVDQALIEDTVVPLDTEEILSATFRKVKFHPGEINGRTVKSQLRIAIRLGEEVTAASNEIGLR